MTPDARQVAIDMMERARMRSNFSNASEIDACLLNAKLNYQTRLAKLEPSKRPLDIVFEPQDLDPDFKRDIALENCRKLLEGRVSEDIIKKLQGYQNQASTARRMGLNVVPTMFVFKGNPGKRTRAPSLTGLG